MALQLKLCGVYADEAWSDSTRGGVWRWGKKIFCEIVIFYTLKTQSYGIIFHIMQVDYTKLWARYKEMGYKNKTDLIEMAGISTNILAKLTKGEFISMDSIQRICKALNCDVGDICVINKVEGNS